MVRYCNYCGKQNNDNVNFCVDCGRKLSNITKQTIENKKEKKSFNYVLIGILLFLITLSSTFIIMSLDNKSNNIIQPNKQDIKTSSSSNQPVYSTENIKQSCPQTTTATQTCDYSSYETQIDTLNTRIDNCNEGYKEKLSEINFLQTDYNELKKKNSELVKEIEEMNSLYLNTRKDLLLTQISLNKTLPYVERVQRGTDLRKYHTLLGDYEKYAEPEILKYLGLSKPTKPTTDLELWKRGQDVYEWLSDNYEYCGDKGLRIGNTYTKFQFFSPDELLLSDNHRCGDCDDFATLFAGLMYASGVSEDDVLVVCGIAGKDNVQLNHCWNWINIDEKFYTIDGVCSQHNDIETTFGIQMWWDDINPKYPFTTTLKDVGCFNSYTPMMYMNPNKYVELTNEVSVK